MTGRQRRELQWLVYHGRLAPDPRDRPLAVRLADREIDKAVALLLPRRIRRWQWLHGIAAVLMMAPVLTAVTRGKWVSAVMAAGMVVLFATSAVRAPHRLGQRLARLRQARDVNAGVAAVAGPDT